MYAFNSAAIFLPGHPYIESTTVLSDKNKNIFEKMSEYVGFSPPPIYFLSLHTLLGLGCLACAIVTDHSVYVGSMWVGVRIHIQSFFRKCFYSCLGTFFMHMWYYYVVKLP